MGRGYRHYTIMEELAQATINTMAMLIPGFIVMLTLEWVLSLFRRD